MLRSYLYVSGTDEVRVRKALASEADAVVIDLEDAVAPSAKDAARRTAHAVLIEAGASPTPRGPQIHVRVNGDSDGYDDRDLDAVVLPALGAIRLPKLGSVDSVRAVCAALDRLEAEREIAAGSIRLYPIVESARGVAAVRDLRDLPRIATVSFGETDFLADIGADSSNEREATLHARSTLVVASRVAGWDPPIDSVHTAVHDDQGLFASARWARSLGFWGKSAIHPRQLDAIHAAFAADDDEIALARRQVAAFEASASAGSGALVVDGEFVDRAVVERARRVLRRVPGAPEGPR